MPSSRFFSGAAAGERTSSSAADGIAFGLRGQQVLLDERGDLVISDFTGFGAFQRQADGNFDAGLAVGDLAEHPLYDGRAKGKGGVLVEFNFRGGVRIREGGRKVGGNNQRHAHLLAVDRLAGGSLIRGSGYLHQARQVFSLQGVDNHLTQLPSLGVTLIEVGNDHFGTRQVETALGVLVAKHKVEHAGHQQRDAKHKYQREQAAVSADKVFEGNVENFHKEIPVICDP